MHMESTVDLKEKQFNDAIKEHLVYLIEMRFFFLLKLPFFLLFVLKVFFFIYVILCSIAYFIINKLRKLNERDDSVLGRYF
jgi:hypothetical protein